MLKRPLRLVGVIALPPLAGAPGARSLSEAGLRAVREAQTLGRAGFDGILLSNAGDLPWRKDRASAETIAAMAVIAAAVRESSPLALGIQFLRNDAQAALSVAHVVGADFIRVSVLSGVVATEQGWIEGCASDLLRERERMGSGVRIFADAVCPEKPELIEGLVDGLTRRALADGVIYVDLGAGGAASRSPEPEWAQLDRMARSVRRSKKPFYVQVNAEGDSREHRELLRYADGLLVETPGTWDAKRARALVRALQTARRPGRRK